MSIFYIPSSTSSSSSADIVTLQTQTSALKADLGTPTSANNASEIVKRDGNGGFSAGTIKIALPLKDSAGADIINLGTNSKYGKTVMPALTTGSNNLGIGDNIMATATTAIANTFIGHNVAQYSSGNPSWNTAVGESSMNNVSGNNNTAVGHNAMKALTIGSDNVAIGMNAGHSASFLTTGIRNTLIGTSARLSDGNSTNAIAIGYQAQADGSNTVQLGNPSITSVKTSGTLYAAGMESIGTTLTIAGQNNTSVVDIGKGTGVQMINVGNNGIGATTITIGGGSDVVKVNLPLKDSAGTNVLHVVNGNCSVGAAAMPNVTATNNTSVGASAGAANITGVGNTFIGFDSGKNGNGLNNNLNTAVGHSSLLAMTEARDNTAVGHAALNAVTTGNSNTAIGKASGRGITIGGGNTFLGHYANSSVATITNSTAIGNLATVDASNMIQLGNTSVTAVKTSGTLYTAGLESIGTTLDIAAQNNTSVVNIGKGTGVQTINVGNNGSGATVINIGGAGDTVNISGTLNNVTTTNTQVADKTLVLNSGGAASTAGFSGIYFEEATDSSNSYMRVSSDRSKIELKAPTSSVITLNQSMTKADCVLFKQVIAEGFDMSKVPTTGGASMAWNRTGNARTTFATNRANAGAGGWEWMTYNGDNTLYNANPQMVLDRDGLLTIAGGLRLPSTGGTASTLNHYEEYSFTTNFGGCASDSGIAISLVRLGKLVTMTIRSYSTVQATSIGYFSSVTAMPAQFRPTVEQYAQIGIPTNAIGDEQGNGILNMTTGGIVRVGTASGQGFAVGAYAGFQPLTVSWIL